MIRQCVDCKYFGKSFADYPVCKRPDPYTGVEILGFSGLGPRYADLDRKRWFDTDSCGPKAKYFVPKDPNYKEIDPEGFLQLVNKKWWEFWK